MDDDPFQLPANLPAPVDDGAAAHLPGMALPRVSLDCTDGRRVDPGTLRGCWVLYFYPMTGRPDRRLPAGWDAVPGARGCTPQACSFRDHHAELAALGAGVFGVSAQSSGDQREAKSRLHLPFELLSDVDLRLKDALRLPTFTVAGLEFFRRLTLIAEDAVIRKVYYPVFPPDRNPTDVLAWLQSDRSSR